MNTSTNPSGTPPSSSKKSSTANVPTSIKVITFFSLISFVFNCIAAAMQLSVLLFLIVGSFGAEMIGLVAVIIIPSIIGVIFSYFVYQGYRKLKKWLPGLMLISQTLITAFFVWGLSDRLGDIGGQGFVYFIVFAVGWLFVWLTFKNRKLFTK